MRYYLKKSLLILLIAGICNATFANNKENKIMNFDNNPDSNQALKTIEQMTKAFHNQDMDNILASYEKDAAIMFEPGSAISDTETIKQMFTGFFQINPEFSYPQGHEVYIANDIALHIAPWIMKGKMPDGTEIEKNGLSVAVLRKQKNGDWLMVLDNPNGQALMPQ